MALYDDLNPDDAKAKKPNFKLPDGFENENSFLEHMRKDFYDDVQFDRLNREAALEDQRFFVGDQWDDIARQRREAARKPLLTINRLPAFVAQIVGARRLNETTIKVMPDNGGTRSVARVREGLLRSIQKISRAEIAYDKALENCVIMGIGNFQVCLDWDSDDVFEKALKIESINDGLSVVWDRMSADGTGRDAQHCFVIDVLPKDVFQKQWPWATASDMVVDVTLRGDLRMNGWITVDDVRVCSYWRVCTRKRTLALMNDGSTKDVTDEGPEAIANVVTDDAGVPIMREVNRKYAQMYLVSGLDILEGPYELPIDRVPVFRVPGWEVNVGEWKHRWGLIRFLKDPQRLHNYWRSAIAEKIMQTPRAVWLASQEAVAGREKDFRSSHLSDNPLLIWNGESGNKPERIPPAQLEESLMSQAELTAQDIKDVSNIHEANLGMPSNEVSGAAIIARQRVSDTGTVIYHDNLNKAIEEAGRVLNELIPTVYDTPRIIKVLGDDAQQDMQVINDMGNPQSVDLSAGKYSVTVGTGPTYATRRIEAAEHMMTFVNAMPQTAALIADLIVGAQDWPWADKIQRRLELMLPPGVLDPKDMTPEQQQQQQAQAQQAQQEKQFQIQQAVAEYMKTQSEAAMNAARAKNFEAQAESLGARVQTEATTAASQAADREARSHLEAIRVADGH